MLATQDKEAGNPGFTRVGLALLQRIITWFVLAFTIGWFLNRLGAHFAKDPRPAGFTRGSIQGALMPMALPNLLFGTDVTIYAPNNTGRTYKLGYTVGVNGCGALFFGVFFWRVSRWRKKV
jgi:hypothetical protein